MKLSYNDINAQRDDIFTDRNGEYRRVILAGTMFMVHVRASRWVVAA